MRIDFFIYILKDNKKLGYFLKKIEKGRTPLELCM